MSERRRLRAGRPAVDESGKVPSRLRRFEQAEWIEDGPGDWVARAAAAHVAYGKARGQWMSANGYDPKATYGSGVPGWWEFERRCRDEEGQR